MIRSIRVFSDRILNIYHNKAIKHSYYWRLWCNYERLGIFLVEITAHQLVKAGGKSVRNWNC